MRKIGLLGGTFNPPHIGHLIIANEVKQALGLDEVRLMPTAIPPHKHNPTDATPAQRLRMVQLAVEGTDGLMESSFEIDRGGVSYTYDTMRALKEVEPETDFYFIIGGDMIDILPQWFQIEALCKLVTFVGVQRPGSSGEQSVIPVEFIDIPSIDLSSTMIRKRTEAGQSIQFLVPDPVISYIRQEGLYGSTTAKRRT
ncbi:nicotinate-nucleotide adenylyltransferase [Sporosarcina sp. OR05]|uniref:nicotinate-nucleotide adenylyltransferase n=1 Tax=Sporosarcina sp. OR05 TaxID=2969819 RepID=UPI00352AFF00